MTVFERHTPHLAIEGRVKYSKGIRRLWEMFTVGMQDMVQTITEAWSSTFMTTVAGLMVAGIAGLVAFCIWSAAAISGIQGDLHNLSANMATKTDIAVLKQQFDDRPGK
jgi:hypothetical protein